MWYLWVSPVQVRKNSRGEDGPCLFIEGPDGAVVRTDEAELTGPGRVRYDKHGRQNGVRVWVESASKIVPVDKRQHRGPH